LAGLEKGIVEEVEPAKLNQIELELSQLRRQQQELAASAAKAQQLKQEFERIKESSSRLKAELEDYRTSYALLEAQELKLMRMIEAGKPLEEKYRSLKEALQGVQDGERAASIDKAGIEKELEKLKEYIGNLNLRIKEKRSKLVTLKQNQGLVRWLETYFSHLTETIERHVMLSIYQEFNELFTNWFGMLIDDPMLEVRLDDEFTPVITQNGYDTNVAHLSGGERTSVALAYRLALNRVINDITSGISTTDLIILDEPTDGFSSEQLDSLREVINELRMKQIIIVSHEPKIESFVESVIYISKQGGISSVS